MASESPLRDPTGLAPLYGERRFAQALERLVAEEAPRLFAIVQEYGERVDARIAAWGLAFPDHAEVVSVDGGTRIRMRTPETALGAFHGRHIRARLMWFAPGALQTRDHSSGGGAAP